MNQSKLYVRRRGLSASLIVISTILFFIGSSAQADYSNHPQVKLFVDELAQEENFDVAELFELFAIAEKKQLIIDAISRPAEKTKLWHDYRKIFVTTKRADQGVEFYHKYRKTLERAEQEFGVPAEIIVAIIGVETRYGRNKGSYRVLDALSTLAFDYPKRSSFFRKELKHFLILARQQQFEPETLLGSYAGAMGYGQFIPSSYRSYAVDYDGDEKVDIWNNPVDAIGSVANYFKRHGWRNSDPVTNHGRVDRDYNKSWANEGLKPKRTLSELAAGGIFSVDPHDMKSEATLMHFDGEKGDEYWVGLHNFYVITRYNHSAMYAMSVYQLSREIDARVKG